MIDFNKITEPIIFISLAIFGISISLGIKRFARWKGKTFLYEISRRAFSPLSFLLILLSINTLLSAKLPLVFSFVIKAGIGIFFFLVSYRVGHIILYEYFGKKFSAYGKYQQYNITVICQRLIGSSVFVITLVLVAHLMGANVKSIWVSIGGLGLVIGFALQQIIANIFSGLVIAIDTPFATNDLIKTSDGIIYQVLNRGLRVVTVRNISTHEIVYLPNQKLANEPLIDLTKPTDDLRIVIDVSVAYGTNLRTVRDILTDIANGHPHIIGDYKTKENSIKNKVHRLYLRRVFPDILGHYIELARLEAESELNSEILSLKRKLENWADFIDKVEDDGFNKNEQKWLEKIKEELQNKVNTIINLTTQWQFLFRNCPSQGKGIDKEKIKKDSEGIFYELISKKGITKENEQSQKNLEPTKKFDLLYELLQSLSKKKLEEIKESGLKYKYRITDLDDSKIEKLDQKANLKFGYSEKNDIVEIPWEDKEVYFKVKSQNILTIIEVANRLSSLFELPPEEQNTKNVYKAKNEEFKEIGRLYNKFYTDYQKLLRDMVKWIVEEGELKQPDLKNEKGLEEWEKVKFSVEFTRTREENNYISNKALEYFLEHPVMNEVAGKIIDEDERTDLAAIIKVWGDKVYILKQKVKELETELEKHNSMVIDTLMINLANWLKSEFKEPFPAWKYPISPVESFGDSSVNLSMKLYIDNVRMEKYLRPYNAFTQLRLRVYERLQNEGIEIPFPQRDLHIKEPISPSPLSVVITKGEEKEK